VAGTVLDPSSGNPIPSAALFAKIGDRVRDPVDRSPSSTTSRWRASAEVSARPIWPSPTLDGLATVIVAVVLPASALSPVPRTGMHAVAVGGRPENTAPPAELPGPARHRIRVAALPHTIMDLVMVMMLIRLIGQEIYMTTSVSHSRDRLTTSRRAERIGRPPGVAGGDTVRTILEVAVPRTR